MDVIFLSFLKFIVQLFSFFFYHWSWIKLKEKNYQKINKTGKNVKLFIKVFKHKKIMNNNESIGFWGIKLIILEN